MKHEDKKAESLTVSITHDGNVARLDWREDVDDALINPCDRAKRIMKSKFASFDPDEWRLNSWSVTTYEDDQGSFSMYGSVLGINPPPAQDSATTHWNAQLVKGDFQIPEYETRL